jgi:hypothetical protein
MKAIRALIRQLVPSGLCPPPPVVSRPRSSACWGSLRPLLSWPLAAWMNSPSPVLLHGEGLPSYGRCLAGCGASGGGTPASYSLDASGEEPSLGPGPWSQAGKCFTPSYAEHVLVALASTLPRDTMSEAQETLFPVPATFPSPCRL